MKQKKRPTAETVNAQGVADPGRRRVFRWFWAFVGLAAVAEFCWMGLSFLLARKDRKAPGLAARIITAGPVEQFAPDTVTAIPSGQFYLARLADGGFLALSRTCPHLGCSIHWDATKKTFLCPCHGSSFDVAGAVITAPAPRPLEYYPVRIENGIIKVDVAAPRRRERFEPAQATRL